MFKHKILLPDGTVLTSGTGTTNAIRSVKLTEQVSDQDDLAPGAACAACAELELWAPENRLQITQGDVLTLFRVDSAAGSEEQVGIFLAEQPVKSSANVYNVTAYDRMTLLDKDLSPWLREQQSAFPMALTDFIRAICDQCSVTLEDDALTDLPNGSYQIQVFYADDLTGRQLIQWAAQAACRYATISPAGKLTFSWYHSANFSGIGPGRDSRPGLVRLAGAILRTASGEIWRFRAEQTCYLQGTLSYQDYTTAPIDKVQIRQSDDDVGVLYPPEETATNALVLQGNLLLTTSTADALRPVAQAIYQQMQGICYTPLSVSVQMAAGLPAPGEILAVTDAYGHTMQTYIMKRTLSGQTCTLEATGNARRDSTGAVNSQSWRNLQGKMLELRTDVDGLSVKASELSGDMASLELTVDGLSTQVKKDYTDLKNYVDTEAKDAAVQEAVRQASDSFDSTLEFYPTTAQMNSAIQQSASEINLSVSQKLEGYVTDADLNQYPTTVEMNSAISQSATQIELTVDRKLSGYATTEDFSQFQLEYDQFKLQVVQDGEVRSAFAADTDSVTITSGVITFSSNTLAVNSDNFTLDKTGNVTATGVFKTNNGISGSGRNEATLQSGQLTFKRTTNDGSVRNAVTIYGEGSNASHGRIMIYGTGSNGGAQDQVVALGYFDGGQVIVKDASGGASISLYGAMGRGDFNGDVNIKGATGLGVSKTVSCQNLNAWGSKNRVVQTGFGPLKMAAFETPEPTFADTGSAQCNGDGLCVLALDPRFAETTDRYKALKWLVTPTGAGSVWVEKGEGFAIVHGVPGLSFDWMCIGTQAGYADVYAQRATEAQPAAHNPAYDQLDYITDITETNRQRAEALIPSYDYGTLLSDLMEG